MTMAYCWPDPTLRICASSADWRMGACEPCHAYRYRYRRTAKRTRQDTCILIEWTEVLIRPTTWHPIKPQLCHPTQHLNHPTTTGPHPSTFGSFPGCIQPACCSSHCLGPGPVRIFMLCGTVHAFNDIHLIATIQSSAMCPATYTTTSLKPPANHQVPSRITTLHDQPGPSRPKTHPSSAPATSPPTFHTSCTSLGTCGRGVLPWLSCARQTPT